VGVGLVWAVDQTLLLAGVWLCELTNACPEIQGVYMRKQFLCKNSGVKEE